MAFENRPTATATFGAEVLPVTQGDVTLDESTAPYGLSFISVSLMDEALVETLDPNAFPPQRVTLTAAVSDTDTRTFDLALTNRIVDFKTRQVRADLATDEYILQSFAKVADDTTPRAFEADLRDLVGYVLDQAIPGAVLEAGDTNADLTAAWPQENMFLDPATSSAIADFVTAGGNASDIVYATSGGGVTNGNSVRFTATAAGTSNLLLHDTDKGYVRVTPGEIYTVSAYVRSTVSRTVAMVQRYYDADGVLLRTRTGSGEVTSTSAWSARPYVTSTAPTNASYMSPYLTTFSNTAGQLHYVDALMINQGVLEPYFSGSTPTDPYYTYAWDDVANASVSIRTPIVERLPELFTWRAGQSAWDFLSPLVNSAGFRLFCDEQRKWYLIDPVTHNLPGRITAQVSNTTDGTDEMGGLSGLYATGVVVRWKWDDAKGNAREKVESAGTNGRVHVMEMERQYPGPGLAQAVLNKMQGQGRTQDVTRETDYSATPGMEVGISLPGTADQIGRLTAVTFVLNTGLMELQSSGLTETPEGAIDLLPGSIDSLSGDIDSLTT